tara:strand:- start:280 stop:474 length:195 start_codon:yes stop_codon:yes gene_type:complete
MHDDIIEALHKFFREEMTVGSTGVDTGVPSGGPGLGVKIKTKKDKKQRRKKPKLITFKEYLKDL